LLSEEGDYVLREGDAFAAATQVGARDLNTVSATSPIEVDITSAVRAAFAAGKTRLTLRYALDSPSTTLPLTVRSATADGSATGLKVTTARQNGVLVDLYDSHGGLLKSGVSIADMRMTEAGTYYLRVYNPFQATQTEPLPFQIEITAPLGGQYHALSDRDTIHGGDGNDVLIGNKHIDFLFGDRGEDAFLAEQVEVRDAESGEFIGGVREGEDIVQSQHDLEPLNSEVAFNDLRLEVAVAEKLGIPVTKKWDGTPLVQEPITASAMVTITKLDLGGMELSDLTGLEFATNLTTLNLANNHVKDLFTLVPRTLKEGAAKGSLVGLSRLQNLALDYNGLASIAPLTGILGIKALSLDGNPLVDLTPIALWREILPPSKTPPLEFLSLDNTGIGPMTGSGLYGEYFAGGVTAFDDPTHTRVDTTLNIPDTTYDFNGFTDLDNHFGVRWTGQVNIQADQDVVFHTAGLGISLLYVDSVLVLVNLSALKDIPGNHVSSESVPLAAGWHDIELEYAALSLAGGMRLSYTLQGLSEQIIPASALRPRGEMDLDPIKGLSNLRILSAEHNALVDLAPISWLDKLELVYLKDNDIQNIGAAAGGRLVDDGDENFQERSSVWLQNLRPVAGAFNTDYQFHAGVAGTTKGEAEWTFTNLRPGRYEVFITWPSHESRASNVPITVRGGLNGNTILIPEGGTSGNLLLNERFSPNGAVVGGRPWQSLGVFTSTGEIWKIIATLSNTDGSIAADAVRIVALDPVLPSLRLLDVSENPLGNDSHIQYVPILLAREVSQPGFDFIYTPNNNAPVWASGALIGPQASRGEPLTFELTGLATDADGTSITYTVTSNTNGVQVFQYSTQIPGNAPR
ncbi:MAG TPA: PA14 domain-containing protein, partial [Candidatus Methylomirabilis sp.]|nr:PA14 domain-containing protein [Candidatus Methylomirabilis sp.]